MPQRHRKSAIYGVTIVVGKPKRRVYFMQAIDFSFALWGDCGRKAEEKRWKTSPLWDWQESDG